MTNRHGRSVAAHFGSAASEVAVCLSTVGIADRSDRVTFELRGTSRDVAAALAALAPVRDHVWWTRTSSRAAIVRSEFADASAAATVLMSSDHEIVANVSDRYAAIAVIGPRSSQLLTAAEFDEHNPPIVLQDPRNAFELLVEGAKAPGLWNRLLEAGASLQLACVGLDALEHLAASHRAGPPASPAVR
jgi:glycine cleavage system aminomethyltransferase T